MITFLGFPYFHHQNDCEKRYALKGWKSHLKKEGFAVLRGVLSPEDTETAIDLLWSSLEKEAQGALSRENVATWNNWKLDRRGEYLK